MSKLPRSVRSHLGGEGVARSGRLIVTLVTARRPLRPTKVFQNLFVVIWIIFWKFTLQRFVLPFLQGYSFSHSSGLEAEAEILSRAPSTRNRCVSLIARSRSARRDNAS